MLITITHQLTPGIINTTVTPLGKKLFHTWLLRPLINIEHINRRLDAVEVLSAKECAKPRTDIIKELRRIKDLNWVCRRIKSGKAGWKDWQSLVEVSYFIAIVES